MWLMFKIPEVIVEAEGVSGELDNIGRARELEVTVSEPVELGGSGRGFTPLELFLLGLASCEVSMFKMIATKLKVKYESVRVRVKGDFELGEGLRRLNITYIVRGVDRDSAVKVVEFIKENCPVYNTVNKADVAISEEVIVD